nr:putative 3,4-dihydroxy-2-butanone kinase isoform X2 [Ipomoea batatas]
MLKDCVLWCMRMHYINVVFEAADWRNLEEDEWRTCCTGIQIRANRCAERVNAVAYCLLRSCPGLNVFFWRKEGLPRGLGRILALEGGLPELVVPGQFCRQQGYSEVELSWFCSGFLDYPLNDPAETVNEIGSSVKRVMGGTSGIIYSILCKAAFAELKAKRQTRSCTVHWVAAREAGIAAVSKYGGASAGYRTLLDALILAASTLKERLNGGDNSIEAFIAFADAAVAGAESTKYMQAQAGRSTYIPADILASVPDPGAMAATAWYRATILAIVEKDPRGGSEPNLTSLSLRRQVSLLSRCPRKLPSLLASAMGASLPPKEANLFKLIVRGVIWASCPPASASASADEGSAPVQLPHQLLAQLGLFRQKDLDYGSHRQTLVLSCVDGCLC